MILWYFDILVCHCLSKMSMSSTKHLQHNCSMNHVLKICQVAMALQRKLRRVEKAATVLEGCGGVIFGTNCRLLHFCFYQEKTFTMREVGLPSFNKKWWCLFCFCDFKSLLGTTPHPVTVTTRIITFLIGNPYKPSFVTVTGWGVDLSHYFDGALSEG